MLKVDWLNIKAKFFHVRIFFHAPLFFPVQLLSNQEEEKNVYLKADLFESQLKFFEVVPYARHHKSLLITSRS